MGKRVLATILCIVICLNLVPVTAYAATVRDTSFEETLAGDLKALGLFQGVSDTDFDLDRAPSRLEAIIMLIRVLGKEQEALNGDWTHPFVDVPPWADKYVGYAYANGLTKGTSDTQFGAGTSDAGTYLTFMLRALGYSDVNGIDFTWLNPYDLARDIGILPDCVNLTTFWRADVATISYAALQVPLKGETRTLAQKLISARTFSLSEYEAYYDAAAIEAQENVKYELTAEEVYEQCSPAVFLVEVFDFSGTMTAIGSGFFIDNLGTAVTNYHVIEDAYEVRILLPDTGEVYNVLGVYDYDKNEDWAILKIDGTGFPYLKLAKESTVNGGATVYAIGSPRGLPNTISQGLVSNPSRQLTKDMTYIQTSAAISHGSSGGALINKYGEVIGVTTLLSETGQNLNMAIPISYIADYKKSNLIALTTLFPLSEGELQTLAFCALRNWIAENANDTVNGISIFRQNADSAEYLLFYDEDTDRIVSMVDFVSEDDYEYTTYIELGPTARYFYVTFTIYDLYNGSNKNVFSATGSIYSPSFNENSSFTFSEYSGSDEYLLFAQGLAKQMLIRSLDYVHYAFSEGLQKYNMSYFGFDGFDD